MRNNLTNSGYEIRVKGHLDPHWHAWFEGWSITNLENGEVLLMTTSVDQSGLFGAINRIRDLNLKLISVTSSSSSIQDSDQE